MSLTELANHAPQLRILAANHDDVGQLQIKQVSILQDRDQLFGRMPPERVDYQMCPAMHEGMHYFHRLVESSKFVCSFWTPGRGCEFTKRNWTPARSEAAVRCDEPMVRNDLRISSSTERWRQLAKPKSYPIGSGARPENFLVL